MILMRDSNGEARSAASRSASDVVVIGAGLSGLLSAALLAGGGASVRVLERSAHIGGTSYVFRRGHYLFPMGALAFGFPDRVTAMLTKAGVTRDWTWKRNHFQLLSPEINIVYSRPPDVLREELKSLFPAEGPGLDAFFAELAEASALIEDLDRRHPDFSPAQGIPGKASPEWLDAIRRLSEKPCARPLEKHLRSTPLINFLGSQGTAKPEMSMLNLAFMWRVMSDIGVWFPSCGIHGLAARLFDVIRASGGDVRLGTGVSEILVKEGTVTGVRTPAGEIFPADWVISTADYKKTFLELLSPESVPLAHLETTKTVPYTGSEICVYLGLDESRVDWSRSRAEHFYFRAPGRMDGGRARRSGNRSLPLVRQFSGRGAGREMRSPAPGTVPL